MVRPDSVAERGGINPMDEIAERRADKANDNRLWSADDCLEDAARSIKGKKVHLAVHWFEMKEDGTRVHHYSAANCTYTEHIALLSLALNRIIEDWKK